MSLNVHKGDLVGGHWKVLTKIGEGGCGKVYKVQNLQDEKSYAMKIEPTNGRPLDQLLKTEALVLQKLQFSSHAPPFIFFDRTPTFRLLVMGLLGSSLTDLQIAAPNRQISVSTTLRIGLQAFQAIWDLHKIYFVHRDIKPSNFALGTFPNHHRVFLFDFGLARSLLDPTSKTRRLRRKRNFVAFRGTISFCSPNVHQGLEHGRHDDLWSLLYMCIEMIVGHLPWYRLKRKTAIYLKERISDKHLLMGCPKKFGLLLSYYRMLRYEHCPDYSTIRSVFESCIKARKIKDNDPFDWEISSVTSASKADVSIKSSTYLMPQKGRSMFMPTKKKVLIKKSETEKILTTSSSTCSFSTSLSSPTQRSTMARSRMRRKHFRMYYSSSETRRNPTKRYHKLGSSTSSSRTPLCSTAITSSELFTLSPISFTSLSTANSTDVLKTLSINRKRASVKHGLNSSYVLTEREKILTNPTATNDKIHT